MPENTLSRSLLLFDSALVNFILINYIIFLAAFDKEITQISMKKCQSFTLHGIWMDVSIKIVNAQETSNELKRRGRRSILFILDCSNRFLSSCERF